VMSPHPRIGKVDERIRCFAQYGVKECWLIHQLSNDIEVLRFAVHDGNARRTYRGVQRIESTVLPDFGLSPELLACW
jgi:Uma2 family endonuclease